MQNTILLTRFEAAIKNRIHFFAPERNFFLRFIKKIFLGKLGYVVLVLHKAGILRRTILKTRIFTGLPIYVDLQDTYTENILVCGTLSDKEAPLTRFLIQNVTSTDVFYDIGASYGFYSVLMKSIAPQSTVHVFEPSTSVFKCLTQTNQINKNMILSNSALGSTDGTSTFYDFSKNRTGSESAITLTTQRNSSEYDAYEVRVQTLDSYVSDLPPEAYPTLLKVDIESAEYEFLLGGEAFLKKHSPILAMELKVSVPSDLALSQKCVTFLESMGYTAYRIDLSGSLSPITLHTLESVERVYENFIFKK